MTVAVPLTSADEDPQERAPIEVGLAQPSLEEGPSLSTTVHYNHQDCVDAAAGVIGVSNHGTHRSSTFTPGFGTLFLDLDVLHLGAATCLPTQAADLPPRNAYVGHYNFKLIDVGDGDPPAGPSVRMDCTYTGVPMVLFSNFACTGPHTFWVDREHVIDVTIDQQTTILGFPVPSEGAVELTAYQ